MPEQAAIPEIPSPVPTGCKFSQCEQSGDCGCYLREFVHWPQDQLFALIHRIGPDKPFKWALDYLDHSEKLAECVGAIDMAAESAAPSPLRAEILALIDAMSDRPARDETPESVEDGDEDLALRPISFNQAEALGAILHREVTAISKNGLPPADDFAWADVVQIIIRHARSGPA